jgi:replication fork protection complex subunit Tof1/Swi1
MDTFPIFIADIYVVVKPDSDARKLAMFKNGHLRLLMTLLGLQRMSIDDEPDTVWIVPSPLTADQLKQSLDLIKQNEFSPPVFDDGREAEDFIRRKSAGSAAKRRQAFDDEDDNDIDSDEEGLLFPAGGPTAMKKSDALELLKKSRRRRRKSGTWDEEPSITEEQRRKREEARKARELEKQRKIKSELFVHDSDDETDEERDRIFFKQEEIRQRQKIAAMKELLGVGKSKIKETSKPSSTSTGKKRRASDISSDSEKGSTNEEESVPRTRERSSSTASDESEDEATDTLLSSPHPRSSQTKRIRLSSERAGSRQESPTREVNGKKKGQEASDFGMHKIDDEDEDEDEDVPVVKAVRRRQVAGFLVDSSDEE